MRRISVLACLATCLAVLSAEAKDDWLEGTSPHFRVVSDAGDGKLKDTLRDLEQMRRLVSELLPSQPLTAPEPALFLLFDDEKSLRGFQPLASDGKPEEWAAFSRHTAFRAVISINADRDKDDLRELVYRQYVTLFLGYSEIDFPLWLDNGMAAFYGNTRFAKEHADVGRIDPDHRRTLGEFRSMHLRDLFAVDYRSEWYRDPSRRALFDAQSWATVHWIQIGLGEESGGRLNEFLRLLREGRAQEEAFAQAMGMPLEELDGVVSQYIRRSISQYVKFPLAELDRSRDFPVRELSPAERDAVLGNVLVSVGRADEAQTLLSGVVSADDAPAEAFEALAQMNRRANDANAVAKHLAEATAHGSENPLVHFRHGEALLDPYLAADVTDIPESVSEPALESLRTALDLAPELADAARLFGFVSLFDDSLQREGIAVVTSALESSPGQPGLLYVLGQLYVTVEEYASAKVVYQALVERAQESAFRQDVQKRLDFVLRRLGEQ